MMQTCAICDEEFEEGEYVVTLTRLRWIDEFIRIGYNQHG